MMIYIKKEQGEDTIVKYLFSRWTIRSLIM